MTDIDDTGRDRERVKAQIEAADPPVEGAFPEPCPLCGAGYHEQVAAETDEYGLRCPGDDASEKSKAFYLLQREFAADERVAAAKAALLAESDPDTAYQNRQRSEVTHQELQADADTRVQALAPSQPWLNVEGVDGVLAQLAADEAAEAAAGNLDIQDRHLTVPGKLPTPKTAPRSKLASAPAGGAWQTEKLTAEQKKTENDSMLWLNPEVDG